ncbi:hypothetical protein D3C87_1279170 [compost metagenome]
MIDPQVMQEDAVGHDRRLHGTGAMRIAGVNHLARTFRRSLDQPLYEIGLVGVRRMQDQNIVAGRPADALVDGVVDAFVRLGRPRRQTVRVATDDVQGLVRAAAVDDYMLDRAIGLGPDALNRLGQRRRPIPHDRDDRHQRHWLNHGHTPYYSL